MSRSNLRSRARATGKARGIQMHTEANPTPQQRIITSEQWVFERRGSREDSKSGSRPKQASISKQEREARRKQRELEYEHLQQEHHAVQSENTRLKAMVARLRQDIEAYTRMVMEATAGTAETTGSGAVTMINEELPPLETLLVNTAKRRKRGAMSAPKENRVPEATSSTGSDVLKDTREDVTLAPESADVGPDEVALMRKLKDVLAEME